MDFLTNNDEYRTKNVRANETTIAPTIKISSHNENNSNFVEDTCSKRYLFYRSNSVSIPVSKKSNSTKQSLYSSSYNCGQNSKFQNYGSIQSNKSNETVNNSTETHEKQQVSTTNSSENTDNEEKLYFGYTKRQLKVFLSLVLLSLNDVMGYSAIAPFFPVVAESKGLSATNYGLIFAAYSVCGIFASLITGTVLVKVGAKFCVLAGMFWNTGAIFCFGFLNKTSYLPFLILSIISRGLMGFGSNTAFTAMFAIVFQEFSERAITVLSLSEALVGVGGMVAPLIGGGLYDLGGFITPFMVLGGTQVILLISCWYMLPHVPIQDKIASRPPFYLLTHSSAFVSALVVVFIFTVNSFIIANLGPFLTNEFKMNATMIGVTFLVSSVFYAGMSPIWGYITDRWKKTFLIELGTLGVTVGMTMVGPATFIRKLFGWDKQHLWLLYIAAIVNGMFFGGALMPTFNEMLTAATELKLSDTVLVQYGLVSGLWNMSFSIGDILGPTLGGLVVENFGFQDASAILALVGLCLFFIKLLQRIYRHQTRHRRDSHSDGEDTTRDHTNRSNEEQPLLDNAVFA